METEQLKENCCGSLRQAGTYVRENPVPTILGALAVGLAIGLVVRLMEREERADRLRDKWEDTEDYLRSVLAPLAKKSKRAYAKSADAVREAVENAVHRANDLDVEGITDPVVGWWNRFWKKCGG
ncbi:MAG TPA: hypothetical protein VGH90_05600 [Chthoniobacteraceae bacterium]|jgi:ElaB/YqjD/DUF883 family membrane-anchored ribosome-binding protein